MKALITILTILFVSTGCSSKKYFEPEDTKSSNFKVKDLPSYIKNYNNNGATLENSNFISKNGISKIEIQEGFDFINFNENQVLASNKNYELQIGKETLKFERNVVAASKKGELLALIFSDNSIALYDLTKKEFILKEYYKDSIINDNRIANPLFYNNLLLFPTLDGKIAILNLKNKKIVRNIVVDADNEINNLIFLNIVNDTLIAATNNKVLSVGTQNLEIKELEIRNIISSAKELFISTIDGTIYKFDSDLKELASNKFKYAKFYTLNYTNNNLYALESQGYIIKLNNNLSNEKVYDFSFDNEDKVISINNRIYFGDEYITFK